MKLAIMQPYFFPYLGYFQLINAADIFVVYDEIEFTKKGWINRNKILNKQSIILPVVKDSDYKFICERKIQKENKLFKKNINIIKNTYRHAPYYNEVTQIVDKVFENKTNNLFNFLFYSLNCICEYLDFDTKTIASSSIKFNNDLKSQDKVININKALGSNVYINPIGGTKLYNRKKFEEHGIKLQFLEKTSSQYPQFKNDFEDNLSIIDVLMFNDKEEIKKLMCDFQLV